MLRRVLAAFAVFSAIALASSAAWSEPKDIRWGTGPVGSVGHKVLVILADFLNKEMPDYRITVLPMPGAVMTVKGFATEERPGRLLRFRRRASRVRGRQRPLQGLQGDDEAPAGSVHVDVHDRLRSCD